MSVTDALLMASTAGEALDEAIVRLKAPGKGIEDVGSALEELDARLNGLGEVLAPLLHLPGITDILVNSTRVWVDCGQGVEPIDNGFSSEEEVRALAITMAAICGKRLDDAVPIVDGILPMGVRVHAVIPPLSGEGTVISLRIPARGGLTLEQMREGASIDDTTHQILSRMLDVRCNVLISGATGSGKTTLLSALLSSIAANERLICIEEISELHPAHPHGGARPPRLPPHGGDQEPLAHLPLHSRDCPSRLFAQALRLARGMNRVGASSQTVRINR